MTAAQVTKYLHYKTIVEVIANYDAIGGEITSNNPDIVILEAVWVTPDQVKALISQFPTVVFITRVHSEAPFLSHENNAVKFIKQLVVIPNSYVAFNSYETEREFFTLGITPVYLPNIYEDVYYAPVTSAPFSGNQLIVGCFGSIRPMKNQLLQAMMAAAFCKIHGLKLFFHMNTSRVEQQGGCVLGNIQALFAGTDSVLVEHQWLNRKEFLELVASMDLMMQLSFNESFNIVAADAVLMGIPIVVSDTIDWMPKESRAAVDNMEDILAKMDRVLKRRHRAVRDNISALEKHNEASVNAWSKFLKSI